MVSSMSEMTRIGVCVIGVVIWVWAVRVGIKKRDRADCGGDREASAGRAVKILCKCG